VSFGRKQFGRLTFSRLRKTVIVVSAKYCVNFINDGMFTAVATKNGAGQMFIGKMFVD
jgi:hypothetical protein